MWLEIIMHLIYTYYTNLTDSWLSVGCIMHNVFDKSNIYTNLQFL